MTCTNTEKGLASLTAKSFIGLNAERFGLVWKASGGWKVSLWVHWVVCHLPALATRHRSHAAWEKSLFLTMFQLQHSKPQAVCQKLLSLLLHSDREEECRI